MGSQKSKQQQQQNQKFKKFYQNYTKTSKYKQLFANIPQFASSLAKFKFDSYQNFLQIIFTKFYNQKTKQTQKLSRFNMFGRVIIMMFLFNIQKPQQISVDLVTFYKWMEGLMRFFNLKGRAGNSLGKQIFRKFSQQDYNHIINLSQLCDIMQKFIPYINQTIIMFMTSYFQCKTFMTYSLFKSSLVDSSELFFLAQNIKQLRVPNLNYYVKLFDSQQDGISLNSIAGKCQGYSGPWLIFIAHKQGLIGAYMSGGFKQSFSFSGQLPNMLFQLYPYFRLLKPSEENNYYYFSTHQSGHWKKGLGFGGSTQHDNFKIWIDDDIMDKSYVSLQSNNTYGNKMLAQNQNLKVMDIEIWGIGDKNSWENIMIYRNNLQEEQLVVIGCRKKGRLIKRSFSIQEWPCFSKTLNIASKLEPTISPSITNRKNKNNELNTKILTFQSLLEKYKLVALVPLLINYLLIFQILLMPKVIDNYVLERNIGKGQFGDVFKGFNKANNLDIAIKTINRQKLKGKFNQLLQNEIKVLKTCNNRNIIKLYDIKKTANNFYLIMEYCNEGDLMDYLKKKKYLTQQQAVEFLIQILNAFKTLVKHGIMHRDFKLPNILKHDGQIKIADFGFSKLLPQPSSYAQTMLGSPLNMAPQVLNGESYNNKVDIWSIGTVFYELLFGKPPYIAKDQISLLKKIKNEPFVIDRKKNKISQIAEDALRKMMVVDPKKRIDWQDLFKHPINFYMEQQIKAELQQTLNAQQLKSNLSKFYIKNNKVIQHPSQIKKKQELNNFTIETANGKLQTKYQGHIVRRETQRTQEQRNIVQQKQERKIEEGQQYQKQQTKRQKEIKIIKRNSDILLFYRNLYVFLAGIAQEAMNNTNIELSEIVGFLLLKKLIKLLNQLKDCTSNKNNTFDLQLWQKFLKTKQYQDISRYIIKQHDIFIVFYNFIYQKLQKKKQVSSDSQLKDIMEGKQANLQKIIKSYTTNYLKQLIQNLINQMKNKMETSQLKNQWIHCSRVLDSLQMDKVFVIGKQGSPIFNFRQYYDESNNKSVQQLVKQVQQKFKNIK